MSSANRGPWTGGERYESYMGRWSRLVAKEFLTWIRPPHSAQWLDVGCGTGALTESVLDCASPESIIGIDPSDSALRVAKEQVRNGRAQFEQGGASKLPVSSHAYDVVVSGLVLNFLPDIPVALAEMARAGKPGGVVATYVWDYSSKMELIRYFWDAAVALKPEDRRYHEGERFPMCQPESLKKLFENANLRHIEVRPIDVPTSFRSFQDYWSSFLVGHFPAPEYAMSLNEKERLGLRNRVFQDVPIEEDGAIHLIARAWAVRGTIPVV